MAANPRAQRGQPLILAHEVGEQEALRPQAVGPAPWACRQQAPTVAVVQTASPGRSIRRSYQITQPCRAPGRDRGLEHERAHPRERDAPPGAAVPRPENADGARGRRGADLNGDVNRCRKAHRGAFAQGRARPPIKSTCRRAPGNANYPRRAPPGGSGPDAEWIICAQPTARTAYLQAARNRRYAPFPASSATFTDYLATQSALIGGARTPGVVSIALGAGGRRFESGHPGQTCRSQNLRDLAGVVYEIVDRRLTIKVNVNWQQWLLWIGPHRQNPWVRRWCHIEQISGSGLARMKPAVNWWLAPSSTRSKALTPAACARAEASG